PMFPVFRQRLLIAISIAIGAIVWWQAVGPMRAGDALTGISLFQAQIGPLAAIFLVIAAGIPAILLGLSVTAIGNPLSGVFVITASLAALAGAGGGIQGFMWRSSLPGGYGWLIGESIIWLAGLLAVFWLLGRAGPHISNRLPKS